MEQQIAELNHTVQTQVMQTAQDMANRYVTEISLQFRLEEHELFEVINVQYEMIKPLRRYSDENDTAWYNRISEVNSPILEYCQYLGNG